VPSTVHLTLIGKPECHLCEVAESVVDDVIAGLNGTATAPAIALERRSILDDSALYERYWEQIPVLLVDGKEHAHWRIDPVRLREAILEG
jgi:hypothetical protein